MTAVPPPSTPRQQEIDAAFDTSTLAFEPQSSDRFVYSTYFVPLAIPESPPPSAGLLAAKAAGAAVVLPDPLIAAGRQLRSDIGVLFLDRTRIRPAAAVLGELLLSLSLAPGEEVTIEQKTFSKRETTFQDQSESEQQTSLQLDTTLVTGLEEGLNQQQNSSSKTDWGISGTLGANGGGVNVSVAPSYSNSVSEGDASSRSRSVKETRTAASKVASAYRIAHKTVMTISTEQRFETTNQRKLRNPNRFTPIDLRYYKIYQSVELQRERYGARLAWAPALAHPAAGLIQRAQQAHQAVIDAAVAAVAPPQAPIAPVPPPARPPREIASDTWDVKGTNERANHEFTVIIPSGYRWDEDRSFVEAHIVCHGQGAAAAGGNPTIELAATPYLAADGTLKVEVHAGWGGSGHALIQVTANFVSVPDAAELEYSQALAQYQQQLAQYNATVASLAQQARTGAQQDAQAAWEAVVSAADPLTECLTQLVATRFPSSARECWEIDLWRALFDWDAAAVTLYPSWWAGAEPPDPSRAGNDFVNASWARLYLPARPGKELLAAELALGLDSHGTLGSGAAAAIVEELLALRTQLFGGAEESPVQPGVDGGCPTALDQSVCLASWSELLPTDGTHLEVVQASTAAEDDINEAQLTGRAAQLQATTSEASAVAGALNQLASSGSGGPLNLTVVLGERDRVLPTDSPSGR